MHIILISIKTASKFEKKRSPAKLDQWPIAREPYCTSAAVAVATDEAAAVAVVADEAAAVAVAAEEAAAVVVAELIRTLTGPAC